MADDLKAPEALDAGTLPEKDVCPECLGEDRFNAQMYAEQANAWDEFRKIPGAWTAEDARHDFFLPEAFAWCRAELERVRGALKRAAQAVRMARDEKEKHPGRFDSVLGVGNDWLSDVLAETEAALSPSPSPGVWRDPKCGCERSPDASGPCPMHPAPADKEGPRDLPDCADGCTFRRGEDGHRTCLNCNACMDCTDADSEAKDAEIATLKEERDGLAATVKSIATMLGWGTVPPRETLERELRARAAALKAVEAQRDELRAIVSASSLDAAIGSERERADAAEAALAQARERETVKDRALSRALTMLEVLTPRFGNLAKWDVEGKPANDFATLIDNANAVMLAVTVALRDASTPSPKPAAEPGPPCATCEWCGGSGEVPDDDPSVGYVGHAAECPRCEGTGVFPPCHESEGK